MMADSAETLFFPSSMIASRRLSSRFALAAIRTALPQGRRSPSRPKGVYLEKVLP